MSRQHRLDAGRIHHDWDRSREPALVIRPGDVVSFELPMAGERQVFETSEVEILELEPGPWGWATIIPGLGLLADDFADPYLKIFDLRDRSAATVAPGVAVPLQPFLGTMGVPTDEPGRFEPFPPHKGGGNVDCRHLIAGSTLWLPVWCEGALFSCGDPHAAQGDGEVCVTAIECDMRASLRFELERRTIGGPRFRAPGPLLAASEANGHIGTMGLSPDLMEGARLAVREMIALLVAEHALGREDAYMLCSFAGDLKILEIVD